MKSQTKTRALERHAHERRLLAIIEQHLGALSPPEREERLASDLATGLLAEVAWRAAGHQVDRLAKPMLPAKSSRQRLADKTRVSAADRYGRNG